MDRARPFDTMEALRFGWAKTRANLRPLLIVGVAGGLLGLVNDGLGRAGPGAALPLLVVQLLQVAVALAYVRLALRICDGAPVTLDPLGPLLSDYFTFLLTSILYGLIVAGGLVLLVVPGVIWGLQFGFAGFLAADSKRDPLACLKESSRLTRGVKPELFVFALLFCLVNLLGAIALGVGLLVTLPTTVTAAAYILRRLQARTPSPAEPAPRLPSTAPPGTPRSPQGNPT